MKRGAPLLKFAGTGKDRTHWPCWQRPVSRFSVWGAILLGLSTVLVFRAAVEPQAKPFCIGVSYASFGTVSRNDASAALKTWVAALVKERRFKAAVQVQVYEQESELRDALTRGLVEAGSMTAEEFKESGLHPENIFLSAKANGCGEHYVIVVRTGNGLDDLADLKGRRLVRHVSPMTNPAFPWLQTLLAERGLGKASDFFGEVTTFDSPSKSVLRVYFRQSDSCLVTTNAFELACELNPQLRKELKVLRASPALIATLFFIRPGCPSPFAQDLESALLAVHSTPAGQQVLTLFQGSHMEKKPLSSFEPTRQILEDYERVIHQRGPGETGKTRTVALEAPKP
jgi:ABC-type phosphate/phosphonate transport system substrate-binding protein